jgi:hypothetical protein
MNLDLVAETRVSATTDDPRPSATERPAKRPPPCGSEAALLGGLGGSSWQADQNVQPDSLLEQMLEPWTVD